MTNQLEPLPPAHCIPKELHPFVPHAVVGTTFNRVKEALAARPGASAAAPLGPRWFCTRLRLVSEAAEQVFALRTARRVNIVRACSNYLFSLKLHYSNLPTAST